MWKRIAAVGVSAGALVAAGLIGSTPASADSTHYAPNPAGHAKAGLGQFASHGEWFYACDLLADSYGVKVNWHVVDNPSNHGTAWDQSPAATAPPAMQISPRVKRCPTKSASPRTVSTYPIPATARYRLLVIAAAGWHSAGSSAGQLVSHRPGLSSEAAVRPRPGRGRYAEPAGGRG